MGQRAWLGRVITFGVILLFSLITLAVAAAYIAKADDLGGSAEDFAGLAVAISVITLVVLTPMLAIDFIREGAVTSLIVTELGVTGVLMILWLATAGRTADLTQGRTVNCSSFFIGDGETLCRLYQATEAFAFLIWLLFLFYFGTLLTFSIIAHTRKNPAWFRTVRSFDFLSRHNESVPMSQQPSLSQKSAYSQQQQQQPAYSQQPSYTTGAPQV